MNTGRYITGTCRQQNLRSYNTDRQVFSLQCSVLVLLSLHTTQASKQSPHAQKASSMVAHGRSCPWPCTSLTGGQHAFPKTWQGLMQKSPPRRGAQRRAPSKAPLPDQRATPGPMMMGSPRPAEQKHVRRPPGKHRCNRQSRHEKRCALQWRSYGPQMCSQAGRSSAVGLVR